MFLNDQYDYFFSYSRDIYSEIAEDIIGGIESYGIKLWVDKTEVILGNNIYTSLDKTLSKSKEWLGAVVIVDETYLRKEWCIMELDYFINNNIPILPILYNIDRTDIPDDFSTLRKLNVVRVRSKDNLPTALNKILDSYLDKVSPSKSLLKLNSDFLSILFQDYLNSKNNNSISLIKADNIAFCIKILLESSTYKPFRNDYILFNIIHNKALNLYRHAKCDRYDIKLAKKSLNNLIYRFNISL